MFVVFDFNKALIIASTFLNELDLSIDRDKDGGNKEL